MRRIQNLSDVQIVLNDLDNRQDAFDSKALDRHGTQVKNIGNGTDPSDAVTLAQLGAIVQPSGQVTGTRTILWSNQFAPVKGDSIPPYCVVDLTQCGIPQYVWVACVVPTSSAPLSINILLNGAPLLSTDLVLPANSKGPVQTSVFQGNPMIGLGSFLTPVITGAGGHSAVSIGLVVQSQQKVVSTNG